MTEATSSQSLFKRTGNSLLSFLLRHWPALLLFCIHVGLALYYMHSRGLSMTADHKANSWDFFWQTLPMKAMRDDLWGSLWNLHAQPPLYNLYGFIIRGLFGTARHLTAQHYTHILLGGSICGMLYPIMKHLIRRPRVAFAAALLISLNPVIFLYEAFILYSLLSAFWVVLAIFMLVRYRETGKISRLLFFVLIINALILTRSAYHIVLLVPVLVLTGILAARQWKRVTIVALLICLPTVGWYSKNYVKFGFFGASSWMGSNLWRIVSAEYSDKDLREFQQQGIIEKEAVARTYFDPPSYFRDFGFNEVSTVDVLSRDDYNNINMIAISKMHLRNAKRLKTHDRKHYLQNVARAYGFLCKPSNETGQLSVNARRILPHVHIASYINGRKCSHFLNERFSTEFTSFYQVLIPFALLTLIIRAFIFAGLSWKRWVVLIQHNAVAITMAGLIFYVTAISCLFEYGENCRFKFSIEALILMLSLAMLFPLRKPDSIEELPPGVIGSDQ